MVGRNEACPCGSGKKFKKCHGNPLRERPMTAMPSPDELKKLTAELDARESLRQKQQGLGRPIIGIKHKGLQFVAVGGRLHYGNWRTFIDFLSDYIKQTLGDEWGRAEIAKPREQRHPILLWYDEVCRAQKAAPKASNGVNSLDLTGAVSAYFGLAYNLYLLAHNAQLRDRLVGRLKHRDQFRGAYYECLVAACFVLAGFDLKLENEDASDTTHCEFNAKHKATGTVYSVEAKSRAPGNLSTHVGNQLYAALRKEAKSDRVVMIDVNLPDVPGRSTESWIQELSAGIRGKEQTLTFENPKGEKLPAPPALVIATNHPYHYDTTVGTPILVALGEGFKIPDFGYSVKFSRLRDAFRSLQKYAEIQSVMDAFLSYSIPSTFSGELPEFEFGQATREFVIGRTYDLSDLGLGSSAELMSGVVLENESRAYLTFRLSNGHQVIVASPLTEGEVAAYRAHPETFFGVTQDVVHQAHNDLEMFKFFHDTYKHTPPAQLLEFMKDVPDMAALRLLPDAELVMEFCERSVASMRRSRGTR